MSETQKKRTQWLHIRLTESEKNWLTNQQAKTTCRKLSDYARRVLFEKKITTFTRDQSLDEYMVEMITLRKELNSIGNNFNQLVKRLHATSVPTEMQWLLRSNESMIGTMDSKIADIKNRINQMADKWLQ